MEKVVLRTSLPKDVASSEELDGPLQSLTQVVQDLQLQPDLSEILQTELGALIRKLPAEFLGRDSTFDFEDSQWMKQLVDSASADILGRLQRNELTAEKPEVPR